MINHSCEPNLRVEIWFVNNKPVPTLWAERDIMMGEELFFDYNLQEDPENPFHCLCGSLNCKYKNPKGAKRVTAIKRKSKDAETITGFNCVLCGRSFSIKQYLDQHYKLRHKVTWKPIVYESLKENYCKECNLVFRYRSLKEDHLKSHLDVMLAYCEQCAKWFKSEKTFKAHRFKVHKQNVYNKKEIN